MREPKWWLEGDRGSIDVGNVYSFVLVGRIETRSDDKRIVDLPSISILNSELSLSGEDRLSKP